jgi:hypothetical protein
MTSVKEHFFHPLVFACYLLARPNRRMERQVTERFISYIDYFHHLSYEDDLELAPGPKMQPDVALQKEKPVLSQPRQAKRGSPHYVAGYDAAHGFDVSAMTTPDL